MRYATRAAECPITAAARKSAIAKTATQRTSTATMMRSQTPSHGVGRFA